MIAAYNAAIDSDIVTLSAGHFSSSFPNFSSIQKTITIRGTGYDTASSVEVLPTYLDNSFTINRPILLEGVYCVSDVRLYSSNIRFNKCKFNNVYGYSPNGISTQCVFTNCLVSEWNSIYTTHTSLINSIILNSLTNNYDIYHNCIIGISPELTNYKEIHNSITFSSDTTSVGNATNVFNTVGIRPHDTAAFYQNRAGHNNQTFHSFSSIFKTFNGTYTEGETFELQDAAASTLLGSDSTQIGIYGGALPFNSRVTDPRIIGHSVDAHSDGNNQIKVYIDLRDSND